MRVYGRAGWCIFASFAVDREQGESIVNRHAAVKPAGVLGGLLALFGAVGLQAQEGGDKYLDIVDDLRQGIELQEVADRAYDNADYYWEPVHGHERDDHDHPEHGPGTAESDSHDGPDEELSAGEAVTAIFTRANELQAADPQSRDIVKVTTAVVDAWPDCKDSFDAIRAAVELQPQRADEIVAAIAVKRDCNCNNGGIWLDQRVQDRIRVDMRHQILDIPFQCSCSQVAMYAGIAGLPENRAWRDDLSDEQKAVLVASMTEKVTVITERVSAMQSMNAWECGCTDVNIAASMQGIAEDDLRGGVYDGLAHKYSEEAGDTGLVVDSFGVVGLSPEAHWGDGEHISRDNVLRRKGEVYRGDNLILDPFHPATEFTAHGDRSHEHLGQHRHEIDYIPTDLFISEYVLGWNEEARQSPEAERDDDQRNRAVELYNGTERTIDLGNDQYFLEIYSGPPGAATETVVTPPVLVKKTISLQSDVTFDFDKSDIRVDASEDLQKVIGVLNDTDIFSELLIVGHTCDMGSDEYNLALSERRANSVRDFLQQNGLKDVTIRAEGHGEAEPRLPNSSEANRSRNRRVDITFVTREGAQIEKTVSQADPAAPRKIDITFLLPIPPSVHGVESEPAGTMAAGAYAKGDMSPRQVIGLNGAIEPGASWVIAYSESDDDIREAADEVTSQLDYLPHETLVLRRLGGEMALNCRAHAWTHVVNFPAVPLIRTPPSDDPPAPPPPPEDDDLASPN
jgi:outer membrane protein OmpA-like peptidoglycan-associated protein